MRNMGGKSQSKPRFGFLQRKNNFRPLRVRIVIAGPEQTGKSCIIKRYCEKRFVAKYLPTVGIDYGATRIFVDKREVLMKPLRHKYFYFVDQVSVHIFDTSGASLFTDVRNEFYREAHGLLMVMDVTRRESFEDLSDWVLEIKQEVWTLGCLYWPLPAR